MALKATLIKHITPSEDCRFQQLLQANNLRDRRLTQLLRHMQQLLGDRHATFKQSLLRELFLQCLPPHMHVILAVNAELALTT